MSYMDASTVTNSGGKLQHRVSDKEKKRGHRRVNQDTGEVTYKKKPTNELIEAIQLGMMQDIGNPKSARRDILMQDFSTAFSIDFPNEGTNITPGHIFSDFRFKVYAPTAFRYFRDLFGIQQEDFLSSLCDKPLIDLPNPGASGSIFFRSADDKYILKTVQHKEASFLQKLLPGYYMNLTQNRQTLLPKFYGLYCYQCGKKKIRFVVMNNILPNEIQIHEKYDLKGSTYKRKASKGERAKICPTFKDLDFNEKHLKGFSIDIDSHANLIKTLERDCLVLQSFKIMDYSLLLGVHNCSLEYMDADYENEASMPFSQDNSIQENDNLNKSTFAKELYNDEHAIPATNENGDRLYLYIGIIDILQSYVLAKQLEHAFKSVTKDGDAVSVHRPGFYANRFINYSKRVFDLKASNWKPSPSKRKQSATRVKQPIMSTYDNVPDDKNIEELNGDIENDNKIDPSVIRLENLQLRDNSTFLMQSSVHSLSTPTHTDCTEGTPSFTASSPSCSSNTLDTQNDQELKCIP